MLVQIKTSKQNGTAAGAKPDIIAAGDINFLRDADLFSA
jgi:hypothetical protein